MKALDTYIIESFVKNELKSGRTSALHSVLSTTSNMKVSSIVAGIAIFASGVASAPLSMVAPPPPAPVAVLAPQKIAPVRIACFMPPPVRSPPAPPMIPEEVDFAPEPEPLPLE